MHLVNICKSIDCNYIIEKEKLNIKEEEKFSFEKLCMNLVQCFKGTIWCLLL